MDAVQKQYSSSKIEFDLVDVTRQDGAKIGDKYHVYLTPTFVITDGQGKEIDRLIGEVPRKTLETFITKNLAKHKKGGG